MENHTKQTSIVNVNNNLGKICSFKPYGEEENICTKCGYVTWSNKNKTYAEIVQQMIDSGYNAPLCYNVNN